MNLQTDLTVRHEYQAVWFSRFRNSEALTYLSCSWMNSNYELSGLWIERNDPEELIAGIDSTGWDAMGRDVTG